MQINLDHVNIPAQPGSYGGSMCICPACSAKRAADNTPKRCADCKYCECSGHKQQVPQNNCTRDWSLPYVSDVSFRVDVKAARLNEQLCGKEGRGFEQREEAADRPTCPRCQYDGQVRRISIRVNKTDRELLVCRSCRYTSLLEVEDSEQAEDMALAAAIYVLEDAREKQLVWSHSEYELIDCVCALINSVIDHRADSISMVDDGPGLTGSKTCPECGEDTMQGVRPGKAQCSRCGWQEDSNG